MNRFKIGTRLTLGFSFLLVLLALLAGLGLWRIAESDHAQQRLAALQAEERLIAEWSQNIAVNTTRTIAAVRSDNVETQRYFERGMAETSRYGEEIQRELRELLEDPHAIALFESVRARRNTYRDARADALRAQEEGDFSAGIRFQETDMQPLLENYIEGITELLEYQRERMTQTITAFQEQNALVQKIFIVIAVLALLTGFALSVAITRSIVRPLRRAVSLAQTVAKRDLTSVITVQGRDETSTLLQALQQMTDNLRLVLGDVRQGAQEIATASHQILAGNQDLSSRTEEQAASLTETASAMEELTATVRQNADNAQQANTLAITAADVATRGGQIVSEVVLTMDSINDSSKKVEDIIGVIDSIAFQTNILALNAAVESARAGEAGRGFAVVAGEVRSLAQRSAQAAREIKELINASVTAAATGNRLVSQTGTIMGEIVEAIQRVTDIMGEITAASQEQSAGIEQVNEAVLQMDQTTRQNAALVEEAAAAADSLQEQANRLAQLVTTFKVADSTRASTRANKAKKSATTKQTQAIGNGAAKAAPSARDSDTAALPAPHIAQGALAGAGATTAAGIAYGRAQSAVEEWEEF